MNYHLTPDMRKIAVLIRYLITLKNDRRLKAIIAMVRVS